MEGLLGWYHGLIIIAVKHKVIFSEGFNVTVVISNATRPTERCSSMSIADLAMSAFWKSMLQLAAAYIDRPPYSFPQ